MDSPLKHIVIPASKIVPFLLLILLSSCERQPGSGCEESHIYNQVVPSVLDSIKFSVLPPPPNDSVAEVYEQVKMLIIVNDSTQILTKEDQIKFSRDYKNISVTIDSSYQTDIGDGWYAFKNVYAQKLHLKLMHPKLVFRYASEGKRPDDNLEFCGQLGLSTIKFDASKQYGVFSVSYDGCQGEEGMGCSVYIVKREGLWKLDKIIPEWKS